MTLMDAQQYDEARGRRRRNRIIIIIVAALIVAWVIYHERDHPERHAAKKFFAALSQQDLGGAYAIWLRDPNWKQHAEKYSNYTFGDFTTDWGPASEWGTIKNYSVDCSLSSGSGVIVQATVNHRAEHAYLYVDKSDKTLHFPPNQIECGNWFGWLTE
ncbi:MAG TPA: hypothetical protein VJO35_12360 [Terriglobales bacterium]|nr:hypothetical protein [Terriglobales bacterium]